MTEQEFIDRLPEGTKAPNALEFKFIQNVYMFHPSIDPINGKEQIATLYSMFGMPIIMDMLNTANRVEKIEDEIRSHKLSISRLEAELRTLRDPFNM